MIKAFGPKVWDAPVTDDLDEPVTTPCGMRCYHCEEAIEQGDDGFLVPHWIEQGSFIERPVHTECWLRQVLGSVLHLQGKCSCHGGADEPVEELLSREGALAVKKHLMESGAVYREWKP